MGKHPSLIIVIVAVVAASVMIFLAKPRGYEFRVKCYFADAQGLRPGTKVRMAGVEIGTVLNVRVRPELRDTPAEVVMVLQTLYELSIPNDSVVILKTAGVLGEVYPEIDIKGATGPPLQRDGVLKARSSENMSQQQWIECFSNLLEGKPCAFLKSNIRADQNQVVSSERK